NIVHAPEKDGDRVRLELFDPKGDRKLERDLPLAGESCSTMSQVVALVLERYFSDLSRDPEPRPALSVEPAESRAAGAPEPGTAARPAYGGSLALGAGFASPPAAPALVADVRLWIHPRVHLGLWGALSSTEREEPVGPPGGSARLSVLPFRASLGIGKEFAAGDADPRPPVPLAFGPPPPPGTPATRESPPARLPPRPAPL